MKQEITDWYNRLSRSQRVDKFVDLNRKSMDEITDDEILLMQLLDEDEDVERIKRGELFDNDPLITEQFLISKGYLKVVSRDILILERPGELSDIHCNLEHGDNWMIITKEDEVVYNGLLPTESQYEVLNQLLKLHD
jgi:hypothetical protein